MANNDALKRQALAVSIGGSVVDKRAVLFRNRFAGPGRASFGPAKRRYLKR
ncbi:MAG: hypothetical protein LBE17_13195 [Treponema sp.]|jgi:hypothetical protein|nr:hypothetical protein [Treponema sp.]